TRWPRDWSSDVCSSDLSRRLVDTTPQPQLVAIDCRRVSRTDRGGSVVLAALAAAINAGGGRLAVSGIGSELALATPPGAFVFDEIGRASGRESVGSSVG